MGHEEERGQGDETDAVHSRGQDAIGRHDRQEKQSLPRGPVAGRFGPGLRDDQRIPDHFQNVVRGKKEKNVECQQDGACALAGADNAEE